MKTLLSVSASEEQEVTVTIKGSSAVVRNVLMLLASLDWASSVGHSGTYAIPIDGDGSDSLSVTLPDDVKSEIQEECASRCNAMSSYGGDVEEVGSSSGHCLQVRKTTKVWPKEQS